MTHCHVQSETSRRHALQFLVVLAAVVAYQNAQTSGFNEKAYANFLKKAMLGEILIQGAATQIDTTGSTSNNRNFVGYVQAAYLITSQSGTVVTLGVNIQSGGGSTRHVRLKLYADSSGKPGSLLCETNSTATPASGWLDIAPTTLPHMNASTKVWLGEEQDGSLSVYGDAASSGYFVAHTYGTGPDPFGTGTGNYNLNLRVTYTIDTSVPKNVSDAGSGADVITQTIPGTDTGSGVEGLTSSVTFGVSDSGSGADSPTEEMDFLDNSIGDESPIWPSLQIADSGVGTETETSSVTFSVGDSGSGVDVPVEWMYYNDQSNRVHGGGIPIPIDIFETGSGLDVLDLQVSFEIDDTGSGLDVAGYDASFSTADSGFGSETSILGFMADDLGSGNDTSTLQATFTIGDVGSGVDVLTEEMDGNDSGSGSDVPTLEADLAANDSGLGSETSVFQVAFTVDDVGSGSEISIEELDTADSGSGSEVQTLQASFTVNDAGSGLEIVVCPATLDIVDAGVGVDICFAGKFFTVSDSGQGGDRFAIRVLRSGRLQYVVRLSVTENGFDPNAFDPYVYA